MPPIQAPALPITADLLPLIVVLVARYSHCQSMVRGCCDVAFRRLARIDPVLPTADDASWLTEHVRGGCQPCNSLVLDLQQALSDQMHNPPLPRPQVDTTVSPECQWAEGLVARYLDHTMSADVRDRFVWHVRGCQRCFDFITKMEMAFFLGVTDNLKMAEMDNG